MRLGRILALSALILIAAGTAPAAAQERGAAALVRELFPLPSATGNEELLAAKIQQILSPTLSFEKDNLGGLYARVGGEAAGLAVLAALDEFGYVVSGVTAEGYLTVDRPAPPPVPIYDSFLIGHPVIISTKKGLKQGIVVQPAMHVLTRERREQLANNLTLDLIFVDIGARSEAEARGKGFEILDPITQWPDLVTLAGGRAAGSALGQKAACAALAAAAADLGSEKLGAGATFVWMAQSRLGARGARASLGATRARNKIGPKAALVLDVVAADRGEKSPLLGRGPVLVQAKETPSALKEAVEGAAREKGISLQSLAGVESPVLAAFTGADVDALILALPAKFAGTPSEVIDLKDVEAIADLVSALVKTGRVQ
jgi:endoglucanase